MLTHHPLLADPCWPWLQPDSGLCQHGQTLLPNVVVLTRATIIRYWQILVGPGFDQKADYIKISSGICCWQILVGPAFNQKADMSTWPNIAAQCSGVPPPLLADPCWPRLQPESARCPDDPLPLRHAVVLCRPSLPGPCWH